MRDAARDLSAELVAHTGNFDSLTPFIGDLRPKQLEELQSLAQEALAKGPRQRGEQKERISEGYNKFCSEFRCYSPFFLSFLSFLLLNKKRILIVVIIQNHKQKRMPSKRIPSKVQTAIVF